MPIDEANHSTPVGEVKHSIQTYPKFYYLVDHDNPVTVIAVHDINQLAEVERLCRTARAMCEHKGLLGVCLEIKEATAEDWARVH